MNEETKSLKSELIEVREELAGLADSDKGAAAAVEYINGAIAALDRTEGPASPFTPADVEECRECTRQAAGSFITSYITKEGADMTDAEKLEDAEKYITALKTLIELKALPAAEQERFKQTALTFFEGNERGTRYIEALAQLAGIA